MPWCCWTCPALGAADLPAFENYRRHGAELSAQVLAVLRRMFAGEAVAQADSGLSAREWRELMAYMDRDLSAAKRWPGAERRAMLP